jgi:catechol 2,3-dioxygenase-like lactoylglutathione lyase family enzyme
MDVEHIGALVPPTVDNIGIAVTDLDAAVSFYEQLGFEVDRYSSEEAAVRPASESAYLYVFETNNETTTHRDAELFDDPVGIDHVSVRVEKCRPDLPKPKGRRRVLSRTDDRRGLGPLRMAGVHDPSSNVLYFIEHQNG